MTRYIIALSEMGVKNSNIVVLLREYSSEIMSMFDDGLRNVFDNNLELLCYAELFMDKQLVRDSLARADNILIENKKLGIKTTYLTADTYPVELSKINNPPAIIYYKGTEFKDISEKAIACVGTRRPSRLSYNAVNYLIPQLVKEGCSVISGLACGVDKISHQACVSSGGKTVAVMAHGLDIICPRENEFLAKRILESGGILMSEYPVGVKANKFRFVNRNRLIVGMSKVVIIYECDVKSGTMHNAEYATKQHKYIFCPALGEKITEIQMGTKKLLDEKTAIEIKNGRDINEILNKLGMKESKNKLSNIEIKKIYLNSILSILHNQIVLNSTIKELGLNIEVSENIDDVCSSLFNLIEEGTVNIDNIIKSLVENNIASISKIPVI